MSETMINYHEDTSLFRDAIRFTAAETGFSERLVEKDYFCTLALADLTVGERDLTFKGGTCLSKIHAEFYRLSEDLDFGVSVPVDSTRRQRSKRLTRFKTHMAAIENRRRAFRITDPFRGFNNSLQYGGRLAYESTVTGEDEFIKVEVSVREPVLETATSLPARTLLVDPFRSSQAVGAIDVRALTKREAYAEKLRAALSRRDPAIRDFFDLDRAFALGNVELADDTLLDLLSQKLLVPGNEPVDMSHAKLARLRGQLNSQLRPVLRGEDFSRFDLDLAFSRIAEVASRL